MTLDDATFDDATFDDATFDVREIPFSRRGSWLDLSPVVGLHRHADDIHLVTHQTGMHAVLALVPEAEGVRADTAWRADPARLTWTTADGGRIDAVFEGPSTLRLRGRRLALRIADAARDLTPFTGTYLYRDPMDGACVFTSYETGRRYRVTLLDGRAQMVGAELLGVGERHVLLDGDAWEVVVEEYETARAPYRAESAFEDVVAAVDAEFSAYVDAIASWRDDHASAAARAAYVLWSATVPPGGFLHRESVFMSKHWMDKVWSWDHCFNALALAELPGLALDQFLTPFDHQDPAGALPDSVTHSEVLYNYVKPPIHGWALARLRERLPEPIPTDALEEIYDKLASWTRFWLDARRTPGADLPHYQHGNDSGWDNSTMFDSDRVVVAPDLAAFLVLQLDELARLADELGRADGEAWRTESERVQRALMSQLHDGRGFFAVAPLSGRRSSTTSLLTAMPIVLGDLLPAADTSRAVAAIREHLTPWGLATEPVDSPHYEADGYWRGPIWAPSTLLIEDGLRRAGAVALADEISASFRRLCETSGFAENFDARSGAGLRDRAYTWTASVYLILARDAALRRRAHGA